MQTKHLFHKHGGRITAIHQVGHEMDGQAGIWFYIGDITLDGGKELRDAQIPSWALCYDSDNQAAGMAEINAVAEQMDAYLSRNGKWHEPKRLRDGRHVHWTPKKKSGRAEIKVNPFDRTMKKWASGAIA